MVNVSSIDHWPVRIADVNFHALTKDNLVDPSIPGRNEGTASNVGDVLYVRNIFVQQFFNDVRPKVDVPNQVLNGNVPVGVGV